MFLKSLRISNDAGVIRLIKFHAGLNLVVDETPVGVSSETGNNVGKTTVLRLIDFCLGSNPREIYTDPENNRVEHTEVKQFLIDTRVLVTLTLGVSVDGRPEEDVVIERNFLQRGQHVRRINGVPRTEEAFEAFLTDHLSPGHYGKKPTFPQVISHNIRYKDQSVSNTLKTLHKYTRDDEYETLHLFMLGCDTSQGNLKQALSAQLRTETTFKNRLESKQTKSAYEASLAFQRAEIEVLQEKMATFKASTTLEADVRELGDVKYRASALSAELARLTLRRDLVVEAVHDTRVNRSDVDPDQLRALYEDVSERLGEVSKSFQMLVAFHNSMVEEKARYIAKELPTLEEVINRKGSELRTLVDQERFLVDKITDSGTLDDLGEIVSTLNERHRQCGEYETVIRQIADVEKSIESLNAQLAEIDASLFSDSFMATIHAQLAKFNKHFAAISQELYGETYLLKVDQAVTKTGQQIYKFSSFNANFSSGKKQGEIICFDIAYTLFADEEGIPCYHFLLNDKKELMHDNQLLRIGRLVQRENQHVQLVASILRDKLPAGLNKDEYIVLKLSQHDKLFKIEQHEEEGEK